MASLRLRCMDMTRVSQGSMDQPRERDRRKQEGRGKDKEKKLRINPTAGLVSCYASALPLSGSLYLCTSSPLSQKNIVLL
jgi:hypothetical protein